MVFARPERRKLAQLSAKSFLAQTWPRKELVLFNSTRRPLFLLPRRGIREIRLRQRSASQMLEICFENANGAWCALWWDDCIYRKDYLETLVREAGAGALNLLRNKSIFDKALNSLFTTESDYILCPLFPRNRPVNFAVELAAQFQEVNRIQNEAELVLKVVRLLHE